MKMKNSSFSKKISKVVFQCHKIKKKKLISVCFLHIFVSKEEILLGELKFSSLQYS